MNTHDIELPPLPTMGGLQEAMKRGPDFIGRLMQSYARAAVDTYIKHEPEAKQVAEELFKRMGERK